MTPEQQAELRAKRKRVQSRLKDSLCRSPGLHGNGRPCPECKGGQTRSPILKYRGPKVGRARPGDYEWQKPTMVHRGFGVWEPCKRCRGTGRVPLTVEEAVAIMIRGNHAVLEHR